MPLLIEGSEGVCPSSFRGSPASLSEAKELARITSGIIVLKN